MEKWNFINMEKWNFIKKDRSFNKLFKKIAGVCFIVLGVIGLFLPLLQGILFILLGVTLLESERLNKIINHIKTKILELKNKKNNRSFFVLLRYLILLGLIFTLPIIYKIFTPLTIKASLLLLGLFYNTSLYESIIIINSKTFIQIIPACIAGSAYLLLLILNLSVPMKLKKRFYFILFSFLILFFLNVLRIFSLSILYHNNFIFFDITHKFFWYILSTVFVVIIWFFTVKLFSIKEIPVYTDINSLIREIKK